MYYNMFLKGVSGLIKDLWLWVYNGCSFACWEWFLVRCYLVSLLMGPVNTGTPLAVKLKDRVYFMTSMQLAGTYNIYCKFTLKYMKWSCLTIYISFNFLKQYFSSTLTWYRHGLHSYCIYYFGFIKGFLKNCINPFRIVIILVII